MHIVFINYHKFVGNSGLHIFPIANLLVQNGIKVTVMVPSDVGSIYAYVNHFQFDVCSFEEDPILDGEKVILHAWTPRENVRKKTEQLAKRYKCPYFVHMEDNEEQILSDYCGMHFSVLQKLPQEELDLIVPSFLSHPHYYRRFLQGAAGVSCIIDSLREFVFKNVPSLTFWPACEQEVFNIASKPDVRVRQQLGIPGDASVITYTGNMHCSNQHEVSALYKAIELLDLEGHHVRLVRAGVNHAKFLLDIDVEAPLYIERGESSLEDIRRYISAANILVQPGEVNAFNQYRFPSKIPMFLASGRPVVLPETNIGKHLVDGENCIKTESGRPEDLADKMKLLIQNAELSAYIGANGRHFARAHFSWQKSVDALICFYENYFVRKKE